jgi:hypothetical protein
MTEVRRIREEDIPEVLKISLKELGSDYLDVSDFCRAMEDPEQFCNVAVEDGVPVGFAVCRMFAPDEEPDALGLPDCPEREEVLRHRRIGLLDSVSIGEGMKGRGIGTLMCETSAREMLDEGCTMICAMAWKSVFGKTNIAGILAKMGMSETVAIRGYWNRMVSSEKGHDCPICGAPCRCFGVFWYRAYPDAA